MPAWKGGFGYTETADGQNIGLLVAARKTFLKRVEAECHNTGARW